jgi:hypothetical protein
MTNNEKILSETALPERLAWRVREFCTSQRISASTFWKYVGLGKIRVIRIGGRVLVPVDEAERIKAEGLR